MNMFTMNVFINVIMTMMNDDGFYLTLSGLSIIL